jgi:hypothetical protein
MAALQFDESKGFDGNLEEFLLHMESIDAELGAILRANISELKGATYEKARKDARDSFNAKVVTALDALKYEEQKSE